jgi:signal transduction histidine kinase
MSQRKLVKNMQKSKTESNKNKTISSPEIRSRLKPIITYVVAYFFTVSVFLRNANGWHGEPTHPSSIYLLITFTLLLTIEPLLSRRSHKLSHTYFAFQTIIIAILLYNPPHADYWSVLFIALSLQAVYVFKPGTGFRWIAIFTIVMAGLILNGFGISRGLPHILTYMVVNFGIGGLLLITNNAEAARKKIQEQQAELLKTQEALRISEMEKAINAERSRLARDLHDSVTQSLHSSILLAEAGHRVAGAGDLERTQKYLTWLGETSQQALKEMRLMVYELRPSTLEEEGLLGALQQRLNVVERRVGVEAQLVANDEIELPLEVEDSFFRIAQEALNNALKHATPTSVAVTLQTRGNVPDQHVVLEVVDDGTGFDTTSVTDEEGMGLASMRERAEQIGGRLTIHSASEEGTRVRIEVNTSQWRHNNG